MSEKEAEEKKSQLLPSVDDVQPDDEGGPIARTGFNYQDEIAAGFLIEMLEDSSVLKVHCETHDDIVIVRQIDGSALRIAEFVQVKASEDDKLWSVADLCAKKGKAASIYEKSLARDKHKEESRFRLVTLRPVVSDLKFLTFPLGAPGRETDGKDFVSLNAELEARFPKLKSPKGNDAKYWIEHIRWDIRHSEDAVHKDNLFRLIKLSVKEGRSLLLELASSLLDELRGLAKTAGDFKWKPDRDKKIINHAILREWWERRSREVIEGIATPSGGKLVQKMTDVGLPEDLMELAVEMRRDYASNVRTSQYMEPVKMERLQGRVKSEIMSLQARYFAGQIDVSPDVFHALCLERMDAINSERAIGSEDNSAFLKGCMYDVADRCLLRFRRPQ